MKFKSLFTEISNLVAHKFHMHCIMKHSFGVIDVKPGGKHLEIVICMNENEIEFWKEEGFQ